VSEVEFRKYWKTVAEYYSEVDRLIGEWMRVLPPDTTVMLVSAHGMKWGKDRPKARPNGTSALSNHRGTGVFVAFGPHVAPNRLRRPISIYDIAPTILSLIGLPKATEMPGQPATWALRDLQVVSGVNIGSYQDLIIRKTVPTNASVNANIYRSRLQAIGHIVDPNRVTMPVVDEDEEGVAKAPPLPPERWGNYAFLNNRGVQFKREKKFKEAVETLQSAIDANPGRPTPYFNMTMLLLERQQFTAAENVFFKALTLGVPSPDRYVVDFAAYYRAHNMPTRAINLLLRGKQLFPQSYLIAANLGSALAAGERYTEATLELERALSMQPASTLVLNDLGMIYVKKKDFGRTLDYWNRSLAIDPRQPQIRDAVAAVRTRL
jgi:Tfp pilus assembly protein PilF